MITKIRRISISFWTAVTVLGSMILSPVAHASTQTLSGYIIADRTLSAVDGPYEVTGTVIIPQGVTLTIDPGVEIINKASYRDLFSIEAGGVLNIGGSGAPVTIRGGTGLVFSASGSVMATNVQFLATGSLGWFSGYSTASTHSITNSEFRSTPCGGGIPANMVFRGNVLKNSPCSFQGTVSGNLFISGTSSDCAIYVGQPVVISGNEFRGFSANNAVCITGAYSADARGNYWGTTDQSLISAMVFDVNDGGTVPGVVETSGELGAQPDGIVEPFATVSVPQAPTLNVKTAYESRGNWNLAVQEGETGNLPILRCFLEARDQQNSEWRLLGQNCLPSDYWLNRGVISSSNDSNVFEIRYRVANAEGIGPWSNVLSLKFANTQSSTLVKTQKQVLSGGFARSNAFTVSWTHRNVCRASYRIAGVCPIESLGIRYRASTGNTWLDQDLNLPLTPDDKYQVTITGLKPATSYRYQVGVKNLAGWVWSQEYPAYTAGTRSNRVKVIDSNGQPLANAKVSFSKNTGGYRSSALVSTNSSGIAVLPGTPAGPGILTISSGNLVNGLKITGAVAVGFGAGMVQINLPEAPNLNTVVVSAKTADGTPIQGAKVQLTDNLEGLEPDISQRQINGIVFKAGVPTTAANAVTDSNGSAQFTGLIDVGGTSPYYANVLVESGSLSAIQAERIETNNTQVWFPFVPYALSQVVTSTTSLGGFAEIEVTGFNNDFTVDPDQPGVADGDRLSVSIVGPPGVSLACKSGAATSPTAFLDDMGKAKLSFCVNAAGDYWVVGNGILDNESFAFLPVGSAPSVPQSGAVSFNAKGFTATWVAPKYNVPGTALSYRVRYRLVGTTTWRSLTPTGLLVSGSGLVSGKKYEFGFTAKNSIGFGPELIVVFTAP